MPITIELKDDRSEQVRYDTADYPIYIHRRLLSNYPNFRAPNHWHDDVEFISVISGEMNYNINGEILSLHRGEGLFINAKQMHFGFSDSCSECDFICILLHPILLCSTPSFEQDFILPVILNAAPYIHLNPDTFWQKEILELLQLMYNNKHSKIISMKVQSIFAAIWCLIYEKTQTAATVVYQNNDLSIVKNMVGFIQKNYKEKLSLAKIANSGSVGQSKCCKLFSNYFNQSPNAYLTQYRLNKSIELLSNTDMTITEIAMSTGFSGASYYSESFKKWIGKSPTEYRKSHIKG